MKENTINWLIKNWKELILFLMTWGIGLYLFIRVICKINPDLPNTISTVHWTIFFTSLFLLFLPFVRKIELGKFLKIEKEVKETKNEVKNFKTEAVERFNLLTSSISMLSQNLTNKITIYNQAPDAATLREVKEELDEKKPEIKTAIQNINFELEDSEEEWIWIFNLLKIRVQLEKDLRVVLQKRTTIETNENIQDIKFYPLTKLYDKYIEKYPSSVVFRIPFQLFSSVANAAIHGQTISKNQYEQAKELGVRILRDVRLTSVLGNTN
ncbi:MAG: hypothetical protein V4643_12850 [Bacteroidota bacterium]